MLDVLGDTLGLRMITLEMFDVTDETRMALARTIRFAVFVDEQRVPPEIELDEHDTIDAQALHVLARIDGEIVGTGRFYMRSDEGVQIGRMAVLRAHRGSGVGRAMLDALVAQARLRGCARVVLHAQTHAIGFYERAGFRKHGPEFDDAGIAHVEMIRMLLG